MKISIKEMLHDYATGLERNWAHDRRNTVGASEVGQCIRKIWFAKVEADPDLDYVGSYGAALRGTIIENHYWEPGLRAALPEGVELLMAGRQQRTLVDGYLSATPDGVLVGDIGDCLRHLGIHDVGDSLVVECKSIDPRVDIKVEKPEHSFQTQVQLGLIRHATELNPTYALISYTDASFLDDVREFVVKFDPKIYEAAKTRARQVMTSDEPRELRPEGRMSGGDECKHCQFKTRCAEVTIGGIPLDDTPLGANALAELRALRNAERDLALRLQTIELEHAGVKEDIKAFLRAAGVRKARGEDWAVNWYSAKGRETVDTKAAEAAGIDLSAFKRIGDPSDRLIVK